MTAGSLRDLRNLGPASERLLATVGITTPAELEQAGAVDAYRRLVEARTPGLSSTMLWALAGAVADVDWRDLPEHTKQQLRHDADTG